MNYVEKDLKSAEVLGIELPTTRNLLKTAFRRRSHEEHPDQSQHPDANNRFIAVSAAYKHLREQDVFTLSGADERNTHTLCGKALSDLGKGLGPTTNGRPCSTCSGVGYKEYRHPQIVDCANCRLTYGRWQYRCRRCEGTGKFKKGGKEIGECFGCKGSGWLTPKHQKMRIHPVWRSREPVNACKDCNGRGVQRQESKELFYQLCSECKGVGEIKIFNPVIPKGLLAGFGGK